MPLKVTTAELVDVVTIAHKYLCLEAVKFAAQVWRRGLFVRCQHARGRMLTVAWRLGYDQDMNAMMKEMLLNSTMCTKVANKYTMYGVGDDKELQSIFQALKKHKNSCLNGLERQIRSLLKPFENTRDPDSPWSCPYEPMCPETCLVAEISAYELKSHLRKQELIGEDIHRVEWHKMAAALERLPRFPFSNRYGPCSNDCVYHRLTQAYDSSLEDAKKELVVSEKLLCMDGYRKHGQMGGYLWLGHCGHCEGTD